MSNDDVMRRQKEDIRRRIWSKMEETHIARFPIPVYGRIPNFEGADAAAKKLADTQSFQSAKMVFCCPDSPQRWVRSTILKEGKTLIMASPRLSEDFILLDPQHIDPRNYAEASTIAGAFRFGKHVGPPDIKIDLKVTGSVAVTVDGGRVGKGGGYSDIEYGLLREFNCVDEKTPIATTVHDIQVVVWVPMDPTHDMPLDIIATPTRLILTQTKIQRPRGISWDILSDENIKKIPLLAALRESQGSDRILEKRT